MTVGAGAGPLVFTAEMNVVDLTWLSQDRKYLSSPFDRSLGEEEGVFDPPNPILHQMPAGSRESL